MLCLSPVLPIAPMLSLRLIPGPSSTFLLFLQTAGAGGSGSGFLLTIVPMIAIFYFLIIMPMRKQQKAQKEMVKSLENGQVVVTSGGIIGTIVSVIDDTLILRVKPDNLKIQIARTAVTSVVTEGDPVKK